MKSGGGTTGLSLRKKRYITEVSDVKRCDMPFPQVRELCGQVRDLCEKVQDLFCQLKDLCGQVAGLWRGLYVMSGRTSEAVLSRWICRHLFWICPLRARMYVFISPKKHSHPSHRACFFLIFSVFGVKGWFLKHSHGRWMPVMGGGSKPSHRKTALNQEVNDRNLNTRCEYLKRQCFIRFSIGNQKETVGIWMIEWFFWGQKCV